MVTATSSTVFVLLVGMLYAGIQVTHASSKCLAPDTIDYSLSQEYCDQPIFAVFIPKTEELQLIDNICFTYFPLPDDPRTFTFYQARVFCDGSYDITTFVGSEVGTGQAVLANPFVTLHDYIVGYAGCDTYIVYRCTEFGGEDDLQNYVSGFSTSCNSIGLSCLRKVQEVINERGLPEEDYYILPMKLPNRCVTQQLCIAPPNPFYNSLPSVTIY